MSNDVLIHVRVRQDARDGFAAVAKEAETEGHRAGEKFTSRFGLVMSRMGQMVSEQVRRAGQHIGERLGEHGGQSFVQKLSSFVSSQTAKLTEIGKTIGQTIGGNVSRSVSDSVVQGTRDANGRLRDERGRFISGARSGGVGGDGGRGRSGGDGGRGGAGGNADVDVDRQSLFSRFATWGKDAATSFWGGFSQNLAGLFSGDLISILVKSVGIAALALALAPVFSAAIVTAVSLALGGGVIALGIAAAFKDPRIQASATELKGRLGKLFEDFGKPFRSPVANFLERIARDVLPQLEKYGPVIAKIFAPLAGRLGDGLIGFIQNLLPGLVDGIKGAEPVIQVLADKLPSIGQALGDFFREMGEHGDDAAVFFGDLIDFINKTIDIVGKLIGVLARFYAIVSTIVRGAVRLVRDMYEAWKTGLRIVVTAVLEFAFKVVYWFEKILTAATMSFGWIPGIGGKLKGAQAQFASFRAGVNAELGKIKDKTVTIRMRTLGLAAANAAVGVASRLAALGDAAGGIGGQLPPIGQAASGGVRSGLTWVGERGPELANLAPGSQVSSHGDSMRMAAAGGGGDEFVAYAEVRGSSEPLLNELFKQVRIRVERRYGGSVQAALGRG